MTVHWRTDLLLSESAKGTKAFRSSSGLTSNAKHIAYTRYHVKPKALYERGVADLANFGFENGQSSSAFDQCAQYPNPRLYELINIVSGAEKGVYLRRSLPSESRSSLRANVSCFACARSRALATTKFATGCTESFLRLRSKYVVQSMSKIGSGQRETRVSRRWEEVGSRRSVTR